MTTAPPAPTTPAAAQPRIVGKLRPSQIISTFGPGSVVDLPGDSVMPIGIHMWPSGPQIHERRLEQALHVASFRSPALKRFGGDIPCVLFPEHSICARCGRFSRSKRCADRSCGGDTYPARLIVICPEGHADEFPWEWWAHRGRPICNDPVLRLENQGRTAALADLIIHCDNCGSQQSLAGALGPRTLGNNRCTGRQPWLPGTPAVACTAQARSVLRGASNVYFSSLLSALSIPPWSNPIQIALNDHWPTLQALNEPTLRVLIPQLPDLAGFSVDAVLQAIQERLNLTASTATLRGDEFLAFTNTGAGISDPDFQVRWEPVAPAWQERIAQIVLASRLREVRALHGFTRVDPPDPENPGQFLAPLSPTRLNWLPAVEHRGEGIFIELDRVAVAHWEERREVRQRVQRLDQAYANWRNQRGLPGAAPLLPRQVLVHTLAHLLIRQLSLDCGYSSSSLRERLYSGPDMCGLLIYTASADSDGSLGGLVRQGRTARFDTTLQALLENAQWCSSDPLCGEHDPVLTGRLNGAADHACALVAETACELANRLLDRALVRDLPAVSGVGYFS